MSTCEEDIREMDNHVTLPRKNADWREAIVKWTRYDYVAIYDYPTTNESETVMEIYKGDMVQVSSRFKRGDWCLCQVGHVLGWVFLKDVRFIVQGASSPRPDNLPPVYQHRTIAPDYNEVETQVPIPAVSSQQYNMETQAAVHAPQTRQQEPEVYQEPALASVGEGRDSRYNKKPMIKRLISFFKK